MALMRLSLLEVTQADGDATVKDKNSLSRATTANKMENMRQKKATDIILPQKILFHGIYDVVQRQTDRDSSLESLHLI